MKADELRSEDDSTRETMHLACIYGWLSKGWDQQRYGCHIDKSPPANYSDMIADGMEASKIYWSMNEQPKPINSWLFYAYGNQEASDFMWHGKKVAWHLWQRFDKPDKDNYHLAWMAVEDFRNRSLDRPAASEEVLKAGMGGKKWAWDRVWKPKLDDFLDQLQAWDTFGVANVSVTIREIRGERA